MTKGIDIEKAIQGIILLFFVWMMYDISYKGIVLKSIHHNTSKASINFDGNEAIFFGILTFLAGTYLLYLLLGLLKRKSKDEETD